VESLNKSNKTLLSSHSPSYTSPPSKANLRKRSCSQKEPGRDSGHICDTNASQECELQHCRSTRSRHQKLWWLVYAELRRNPIHEQGVISKLTCLCPASSLQECLPHRHHSGSAAQKIPSAQELALPSACALPEKHEQHSILASASCFLGRKTPTMGRHKIQ